MTQQNLLKALGEPNNMKVWDWEELQERIAVTIRLCLADEVLYHAMKLKSSGETIMWKRLTHEGRLL